MIIAKFIYVILLGYLLGSIPFGLLISKRKTNIDPREIGSGMTGATNVMRSAGTKAAFLVLILDLAKGMLAVGLASLIFGDSYLVIGDFALGRIMAQVLAALACIAGHNWSIFLKFRGGRGVATYFGGLVALCPPAALFGGELFFISAGLTRYASLGSIAGAVGSYAIMVPLTIAHGFPIEYISYTLVGGLTIIVMHRGNIQRLVTGKERKLGEKVNLPPSSGSAV